MARGSCFSKAFLGARKSLPAIHYGLHQIAELLSSELVAFEIRCQVPSAIDDDGVERMRQQALLAPEVHAKHTGDLLDLGQRPGEEVPNCGVRLPDGGVLSQYRTLIVLRVDGDGQQYQVSPRARRKAGFHTGEVVGETEAIIRIWTA